MATQTATPNKPRQDLARRAEDSGATGAFRRRARDGENGAGERASSADVAGGGGGGIGDGKRGRIGIRQGTVSELTVIAPFAPGGAERLRAVLRLLNGNFSGGRRVGTVHNMRFVFLDNDTKFLFATAYDGAWDPYIEDFATKIPNEMDIIFSAFEGWPGIRSPKVKDWIVEHQIPAEGWYVAHPDLSVAEAGRLKHIGKAVDEFLDKLNE